MNTNLNTDFGIEFTVECDMPNQRRYRATAGSFDIDCPFCGSKRKFNVNPRKNVARCNKCSGDTGYNTVTLHAELTGLSTKEAYKDLLRRWNGLSGDEQVEIKKKKEAAQAVKEIMPAPIEVRDIVYRRLLSQLDLSKKHREDLIKRGLTDEEIEKGLYKTVPVCGLHSLASYAIKGIEFDENHGIPGFVDISNPKKVLLRPRKNGYFVPVLTIDGLISGMQIRYDNLKPTASDKEREMYKKYSWYSSSEKDTGCGVSGCENIHFAGDWSTVPKACCLTEGVLKADIAAYLSGKPFMGLVGVNNVGQLTQTLTSLSEKGLESVYIYVDMDYRDKREVKKALDNIKKKINQSGHITFITESEDAKITEGEEYVKFDVSKELPETMLLFIGKALIPKEKVKAKGKSIFVDKDFLYEIRNTSHKITVVNGKGIDTENLTKEKRTLLISKRGVTSFSFKKIGLTYHTMTWDEDYKGIDDYLLHLKTQGGPIQGINNF